MDTSDMEHSDMQHLENSIELLKQHIHNLSNEILESKISFKLLDEKLNTSNKQNSIKLDFLKDMIDEIYRDLGD